MKKYNPKNTTSSDLVKQMMLEAEKTRVHQLLILFPGIKYSYLIIDELTSKASKYYSWLREPLLFMNVEEIGHFASATLYRDGSISLVYKNYNLPGHPINFANLISYLLYINDNEDEMLAFDLAVHSVLKRYLDEERAKIVSGDWAIEEQARLRKMIDDSNKK